MAVHATSYFLSTTKEEDHAALQSALNEVTDWSAPIVSLKVEGASSWREE